jgi:hypothetical protein
MGLPARGDRGQCVPGPASDLSCPLRQFGVFKQSDAWSNEMIPKIPIFGQPGKDAA